jgi:hypothetical protein
MAWTWGTGMQKNADGSVLYFVTITAIAPCRRAAHECKMLEDFL